MLAQIDKSTSFVLLGTTHWSSDVQSRLLDLTARGKRDGLRVSLSSPGADLLYPYLPPLLNVTRENPDENLSALVYLVDCNVAESSSQEPGSIPGGYQAGAHGDRVDDL